jgi:hypothetical protein
MTKLTPKEERKVLRSAQHLFSIKSLIVPRSLKDIPIEHYLTRKLRVKEGRSVYLTDSGYEHFRTIVDILDQSDFFDGMAAYSDIWEAWHKALSKWLGDGLMPDSVDEVLQSINDQIAQKVDNHTFIVPIRGLQLDGLDSFAIGKLSIFRMSGDELESSGVKHDHADVPRLLELNKNTLWLRGTVRGTEKVALRKFSDQATLTAGMLAITAAAIYERGASSFRISIVLSPDEVIGRSMWFSWSEQLRTLNTHYQFPKGQFFPLNTSLMEDSDLTRIIRRSFAILHTINRTQLEDAIARSVYWFSDAHRDSLPVMQLIKYWSCVEAFFSFKEEEITHAVSSGLASLLAFGGFHFIQDAEYSTLKKKISTLYKHRSRAVHHGSHEHVTERDLAQFSQWVAWMIISMVALVEQGYTTLEQVKEQTDRLDGLASQKHKSES